MERQTAATAHLKSEQLLLFTFARYNNILAKLIYLKLNALRIVNGEISPDYVRLVHK